MLASITLAVGLVVAIPVPEGPEPVELFAAEAWYKDQAGKEQDFTGLVVELARNGRVGFGRNNPYRLLIEGDKRDLREVYVGGKPDALRAFVGKKVKLTGKAVDMEVEGSTHREIWPARLVVLDAEMMPAAKVQERLLDALRKQVEVEQRTQKEIEAGFNQPIADPNQATRMKLQHNDAARRAQELLAKIAELERPAGAVGGAPAEVEALKREVQQQRAAVEAAQAQLVEIRTKLAAVAQQNPAAEVLKKIEAVTAESQARLEAERAKLAELEARYQRAIRLPQPPVPPQGNAGDAERLRAMVREVEALQAEAIALAQKAQAVNDPNAAKELLEKQAAIQQQRDAIAKEILKLRGGK